jgi:NADPH-dependent 2,4-dienoyl-CoA reductase/sulfur reductase-like enzyme/nitrite reductase/ring-hydroxylating ferredoxin subunit
MAVAETTIAPSGPDLTQGTDAQSLADGSMLTGRVGSDTVLLARVGTEFFAVGATCTHYGGPLVEGLLVDHTVRCPWHHACFDLRTGVAARPPALNDLPRWRVETRDGRVFVREKLQPAKPARRTSGLDPASILILGAGAAGNSAAETLRREGFAGRITLVDPDSDAPYDRPNLSKDYLAGTASEEWIPLHPRSYYSELGIERLTGRAATAIDPKAKRVVLDDGSSQEFDRLLIATGASPLKLALPRSGGTPVRYLRSLADSRSIVAAAKDSEYAVVIGTSFIGLEVAASLRTRGLDVHVVGTDAVPLRRVFGTQLGAFIRRLHEGHGVVFHLGHTVEGVGPRGITLDDGTYVRADLIVAGVGVRPNVKLAIAGGIATDNGILVDERLETSAKDIFAAGDVARWIDPETGERIRVEHWVVAQRMGQAVARNMLGHNEQFAAVPFFWSQHYDVPIAYVGHAAAWDRAVMDGDPDARDCAVTYYQNGRALATATIYRDTQSLSTELMMEQAIARAGNRNGAALVD